MVWCEFTMNILLGLHCGSVLTWSWKFQLLISQVVLGSRSISTVFGMGWLQRCCCFDSSSKWLCCLSFYGFVVCHFLPLQRSVPNGKFCSFSHQAYCCWWTPVIHLIVAHYWIVYHLLYVNSIFKLRNLFVSHIFHFLWILWNGSPVQSVSLSSMIP